MVTANLRRTFVHRGVAYGPGEVKIPEDLATVLGVKDERPVSDESRELAPAEAETTPRTRSGRKSGGRKAAAKKGGSRKSTRKRT